MGIFFEPIINLWLRVTDLASTGVGQYLDNILFTIVGLVFVVIIIIFLSSWISTPVSLSVDEMVENSERERKLKATKSCYDCMHYDEYTGTCNSSKKSIDDPRHRVCGLYIPSR